MLKQVLNLKGAQALNKSEQQSISGGSVLLGCPTYAQCSSSCMGIGSCIPGATITVDGFPAYQTCYTCMTIGNQ